MIANGLLENPSVDAAVMFHVLGGMPSPPVWCWCLPAAASPCKL